MAVNARQGVPAAFLGMLDPVRRRVRYWLTSGSPALIPDRIVGAHSLGARNRLKANVLWLVSLRV